MPGFDRTGPAGRGIKTGRRMGICPPETGEGTESQLKAIEAREETVTPEESSREPYGPPFGSGRGAGRGRGPGARQGGQGFGRGFCGGRISKGQF